MKVIIAGSRSIDRLSARCWDYTKLAQRFEDAVAASGFEVTEVITGGAGGPDRAGEQWASKHGIPVTTIKPNWNLGKGAGLITNRQLAAAGEALIALYDGQQFPATGLVIGWSGTLVECGQEIGCSRWVAPGSRACDL